MKHLINCKGVIIDLSQPKIMGILNVTPDSFFDGGKHILEKDMLKQTEKMLNDGADFIDIGAYSSKPNASFVSPEEELRRLLPSVEKIKKHFPNCILSIDTFRAEVAEKALQAGGDIINDISAGQLDDKMFSVVAKEKAPYIMMHMKGTPQTMQQFTDYDDVTYDIIYYFSERINKAIEAGIKDIVIDPGFGFSKTLNQNYELMNKLHLLQSLDLPILCGISRKSMIYKLLETSPEEALNGTTTLNTISLMKGAKILRVHDVKQAKECVKIYSQLNHL